MLSRLGHLRAIDPGLAGADDRRDSLVVHPVGLGDLDVDEAGCGESGTVLNIPQLFTTHSSNSLPVRSDGK